MQATNLFKALSFLPLVAVTSFLLSVQVAHASSVNAVLSITPSTATVGTSGTLPVDIKVDTGGQGASGVDIYLTLPSNITYVSYDGSSSVFTSEVTPPTLNGSILHLARLLSTAGGYTGSSGEVIHLVFNTTSTAGAAVLAINQSTSVVDAYSDSSNILASVQNGNYTVAGASPTSTPVISSPTPTSVSSTPSVKSLPVTGNFLTIDLLLVAFSLLTLSLIVHSASKR